MTTATIKPAAWRVSMGTTADHNYWHYFGKKPKTIDDGEIWEPLYSASTLESLQRENEELVARANEAVEAANALQVRADTAEAEVTRLQAEIDRKSSMPGDHRYWEGRYRDEAAENEKLREEETRLRETLFKCGSFIADRYQEGDAEYQVVLLVNDAICCKPALSAQVHDVAGLESNPVTLRWWCQQLLDIIENYDISHDSCDEEIALINDIRSSVDPAAPVKQAGGE